MREERTDDFGLAPFENEIRQDFRQMFSKPCMSEAKLEVLATKTGWPNAAIFFAHPSKDGIEKNLPPLADADFASEAEPALSKLLVVSDIARDAYLPFSIEDASKVSDLRFVQHGNPEMVCSHERYTISYQEGIAA